MTLAKFVRVFVVASIGLILGCGDDQPDQVGGLQQSLSRADTAEKNLKLNGCEFSKHPEHSIRPRRSPLRLTCKPLRPQNSQKLLNERVEKLQEFIIYAEEAIEQNALDESTKEALRAKAIATREFAGRLVSEHSLTPADLEAQKLNTANLIAESLVAMDDIGLRFTEAKPGQVRLDKGKKFLQPNPKGERLELFKDARRIVSGFRELSLSYLTSYPASPLQTETQMNEVHIELSPQQLMQRVEQAKKFIAWIDQVIEKAEP